MAPSDPHLTLAIRDLAVAAGQAILAVARQPAVVRHKEDRSPLTAADEASDAVIVDGLARLTPAIPVVSEERVAGRPATTAPRFWLVDPLDGTKEFIAGNGEYTVNIALIEHGVPTLGVVHVPTQSVTYFASAPGSVFRQRADEKPVALAARARVPLCVALASRSHGDPRTDSYLHDHGVHEVRRVGSSVKFCLIAAGEADLYPRFGPTMEWDTAAGHAVLAAAGGSVTTLDGAPLRYGKPDWRNPDFIARGRR
ncbi:MAG: 3'(2'),5'-bisphosphate nucleotidase [Alphaproteobacteria bacterium]|nr:3'(2'),5'-bisphosphate nucleotidase [Alphaproteobacteria bacterium]